LDNKVVVVTEPDYWFGHPNSVFLLGVDNWTVEQFIKELPLFDNYSLHVGENDSSIDWIVNTAKRAGTTIVSTEYTDKIVLGYLMSLDTVWWCADTDYTPMNSRRLTVPVDWLLQKRLKNGTESTD